MENLEISQENQETHEEDGEKEIQLEVVIPKMKTQLQNGESSSLPKEWRFIHNHLTNLIISDPSKGLTTRNFLINICENLAFLSQIEFKNFYEVEFDEH